MLHAASGATAAFPPTWRRIRADHGAGSAALFDRHQRFLAYLNLTPQQGEETLPGWARFRVEHNAEEGDRGVRMLASADGLRFRAGRGACVKDSYATTQSRYVELACLVVHGRVGVVIVGAAPPSTWSRLSPLLERAIDTVSA